MFSAKFCFPSRSKIQSKKDDLNAKMEEVSEEEDLQNSAVKTKDESQSPRIENQ